MVHPDNTDFGFEKTYKVYTDFRKKIEEMDQPVRPPLANALPTFPEAVWKFKDSEKGEAYLDEL